MNKDDFVAKNLEKHHIDGSENYYMEIESTSTHEDILIFNFNDFDGHNGDKRSYANYITKDELKKMGLFILNYLDKHPKVD
jgi:phosphopentomutase